MKLARVEHRRCDHGWGPITYVWVDDGVSPEQFQAWCVAARDAFLKAEADFGAEPPAKFPGYHFDVNKADPGMTVAEAQAEFKRLQAEHQAWEKRKQATKHAFAKYLTEQGGGKIVSFYEYPPQLSGEVAWGHRHGMQIDYSETNPTENDFNAPQEEYL